jgi:predicted MFS family arabinose efflux permease
MLSGLTVANLAGVPLGTLLGQQLGWRATFWAMAALGLLAAVATTIAAPITRGAAASTRSQLAAFRNRRVRLALLATALAFGAVYAPFTYVAPLMTEVAGFSRGALPWLLALFGLGLVLGNVIGARSADRRLMGTLVGASAAMLVVLIAFAWTARAQGTAAITLPDAAAEWIRAESAPGRRLSIRLSEFLPAQHRLGLFFATSGYQPVGGRCPPTKRSKVMLVLGLILLLLGIFLKVSILYTIGIILLVIGAVLWILGAVGRPVGGRKVWF